MSAYYKEKIPVRNDEIAIPIGDKFIVVSNADVSPDGIEYVRIVDADGFERQLWNANEWQEEPELVMGAIFGAVIGEINKQEL